jgi:hypothetical protein
MDQEESGSSVLWRFAVAPMMDWSEAIDPAAKSVLGRTQVADEKKPGTRPGNPFGHRRGTWRGWPVLIPALATLAPKSPNLGASRFSTLRISCAFPSQKPPALGIVTKALSVNKTAVPLLNLQGRF